MQNTPADKLLIVGIDTLAGSNIALTLADRCEIVGLSGRRGFALEGCRTLHDSRPRLEPQLAREHVFVSIVAERPRWIVYCGPRAYSSWDERTAAEASGSGSAMSGATAFGEMTFDATQESTLLAAACRAAKECSAKLAFISTDAACSGPQMFQGENLAAERSAARIQRNSVCNSAQEMERQLAAHEALILRTHLYGWSAMGESYAENLWMTLEDGLPLVARPKTDAVDLHGVSKSPAVSGNRYASPILASDFAELLWAALRHNLTGLFHAAGAERASQWQFAAALAAASGMWIKGVQSRSASSSENAAKSASRKTSPSLSSSSSVETSLDSRRLQRALHQPLPRLRDGLERFTQQATNSYRDSLRAAFFAPIPEPVAA
jgi:dTDP-4-dehydrorhamnose reductase